MITAPSRCTRVSFVITTALHCVHSTVIFESPVNRCFELVLFIDSFEPNRVK